MGESERTSGDPRTGHAAGEALGGDALGGDFRAGLYGRYVSAFRAQVSPGAEASFAWLDHRFLPLLDGLDRAARVLDIGCGDGALLDYLGRRSFTHASGIDIAPEQVALACQRGVDAQVGDIHQTLTTHTDAFGAILAVDIFEHFSREELVRLAPLLHAALRPGGRLIVQTANGAGLLPGQVIYGDLTHLTIFTPQTLVQLLRPVGFGDFAFYETGPIPLRLRGRLNVAAWATIKAVASTIRRIETGKRQTIWTQNFLARAFKR